MRLLKPFQRRCQLSARLALEIWRDKGSRSLWAEVCAQRWRTLRLHQNVGVRAVACETWTSQKSL